MLDEPVPLRAPSGSARRHASFLLDVSAALARADAPFALAEAAANASSAFCDACVAYLAQEPTPFVRIAIWRAGAETRALLEKAVTTESGFVQEAIRCGQSFRFHRGATRDAFLDEVAARVLQATSMESMIVVPLAAGSNPLGALIFLNRGDGPPYDDTDVRCAAAVARQLSMAIENAALHDRERRALARARLLGEATDRLFSTTNEFEMLNRLLDVVVEQFADWALAAAVSDGRLVPVARVSPFDESAELQRFCDEYVFGSGQRAIVEAIRQQQPMRWEDPPWTIMAPLFAAGHEYGAVFCRSQSHRYDLDDLEALRELCRRTSLALEYANSFARERRLAQTLQQATLPPNLAEVPGTRVDVVYQPAAQEEQVGGDWYDVFPLGEGRVLASIGDVTGHGLPAWAVMSKLRHSLNVVAKYETNPARMLDVAEQVVLHRYPEAIATAFVGIVDTQRGTITYANAGHPAPMVRRRDGNVEVLRSYGLPIGLRALGPPGDCHTASLRDADLLVFYTDGLIESTRNAIEGERWLVRALGSKTAYLTVDSANFVKSYCLRGAVPDDVAILTMNFVPMHRWAFLSSDRESAQDARDAFYRILRESGVAPDDRAAAELIFGELVGNVARHAPGPVEVALELQEDRAVLHVIDRGPGYRIAGRVRADVLDEGGRGLWLAQRLAAAVEVEPVPGFGTHTAATLHRCRTHL